MSTGNTGTVSSHFNFTLPGYDDDTDIDELNTNFNIIDTSLYDAVQDIATNASDISTLRDSVNLSIRRTYMHFNGGTSWQTSMSPSSGSIDLAFYYDESAKTLSVSMFNGTSWTARKQIASWS